MCGLAGTFLHNSCRSEGIEKQIESFTEKLSHRGPDDRGYEIIKIGQGELHLIHTRLSILDLSSLGHQPMSTIDGRLTIIFNGEIYNYKELRDELVRKGLQFRTQTDTEVLLQAWSYWGEETIHKLNGMFSFVIVDRRESLIWCVRDAFGIKPFYYSMDENRFRFASEIPALLEMYPKKPPYNIQSCYNYLMFGMYGQGIETFYEGIEQLPAGHLLKLDLKQPRYNPVAKKWWNPSLREHSQISFQEASEKIRSLFLENIRLHLRSDVPLGAALSGGIDSSAVVCSMRKLYPDMPIHTFSYIPAGSDANEEKWIDLVNERVGAIPHKIEFTSEELLQDLDDLIQTQGEPFSSTSIYAQYRVFKKAKESGITVTLDGQGADELLAGYDGYPIPRFRSLLERREYRTLWKVADSWKKRHGRTYRELTRYMRSALVTDDLRDLTDKMGRKPKMEWLNLSYLQESNLRLNHRPVKLQANGKGRRLTEALYNSLTVESLGALLRHGDRNSMRWSVESRVPFLTTNFAEYLFKLPENFLMSDSGQTKHLFREAMRGIVPDLILDRQDKIGFQTPEKEIISEIGKQVMESVGSLEVLPFLNMNKLKQELEKTLQGEAKQPLRVWHLYNMSRFIHLGQ